MNPASDADGSSIDFTNNSNSNNSILINRKDPDEVGELNCSTSNPDPGTRKMNSLSSCQRTKSEARVNEKIKLIWANLTFEKNKRTFVKCFIHSTTSHIPNFNESTSSSRDKMTEANSNFTLTSQTTTSTIVPIVNSNDTSKVKDDLNSKSESFCKAILPSQFVESHLSETEATKISSVEGEPGEKSRKILQSQSGYIESGTLTALMGPSGSGKSSLLNCITCRVSNGVRGEIVVRFDHMNQLVKNCNRIRIGFVPQKDHLFGQFTIGETLTFAMKMNEQKVGQFNNNSNKSNEWLGQLLQVLDLTHERNTKIAKLSGGQLKRTSIAVEMISRPEILILDEPTSGLDSDTSEKVICLLKNLTEKMDLAIICSIHQPSFRSFNKFNMVYMINKFGSCIYFDSPNRIVDTFASFGLEEPQNVNLADFAIEVANGRFGVHQFDRMAHRARLNAPEVDLSTDKPMAQLKARIAAPFGKQIWLLFVRYFSARTLKSPVTLATFVGQFLTLYFFSMLYQEPTGLQDGCWSSLATSRSRSEYLSKLEAINSNVNILFSLSISLMFFPSTLAVIFSSSEMVTILNETSNSWYGPLAYFISRSLGDLLIISITTFPCIAFTYYATEQIVNVNRIICFLSTSLIYTAIWDAKGVLVGTLLSDHFVLALIAMTLFQLPSLAFSGFNVKPGNIFWPFKPLTFVSEAKYLLESSIIAIYGFGRCSTGSAEGNHGLQASDYFEVTKMDPFDALVKFWPILNVTQSNVQSFASHLGLDENYLDPVYERIGYFVKFNARIASVLSSVKSKEDHELSFVLSYWKLNDVNVTHNLIVLLSMLFIYRIAIYFAFIFKKSRPISS